MSEQGKARIAADGFGKRATYEEIEIGKALETFEWVVTEDDIEKQCRMDEDYHEWYAMESPWGGRIAPPQIQYRPPRWMLTRTYNVRGVFYKWEFETFKAIKPGETITVTGRIVDKWIRNDREFIKFETEGTDAAGDRVFVTQRTHVLDVIERSAPREGVGIDSGHKPEKI
jgi:acyl dehydratase